jgi:hypothetical protein
MKRISITATAAFLFASSIRAQTPARVASGQVVLPRTAQSAAAAALRLPARDTSRRDTASKVLIAREVFQYQGGGRRDPFVSLLNTSELKPLLNDLKLVGVAYDPRGKNSVAVLRDVTSKDQYKVRVGETLGRMRVAAIQPKAVIFTIEEFGYSRQELLPIAPPDSTKMRQRQ